MEAYEPLKEMINQARQEGKMLYCHYQSLWFTPDQLENENKNGRFRWGPVNWSLRDGSDLVTEKKQAADKAQRDLENAIAKVKGSGE